MMIFGDGTLGKEFNKLGHEVWTLMMGLMPLEEETPESWFSLYPVLEGHRGRWSSTARKRVHTRNQLTWHLDLGLLVPEL